MTDEHTAELERRIAELEARLQALERAVWASASWRRAGGKVYH